MCNIYKTISFQLISYDLYHFFSNVDINWNYFAWLLHKSSMDDYTVPLDQSHGQISEENKSSSILAFSDLDNL